VGKSGRAVSLVAALDLVAFNRLVKRYHVEVKEIPVPTDEEVQERKADRIVESLAEAGRRLPLDDFLDLGPAARRVAAHELRDRIVALLLKGHLAAAPPPAEEEEAPAVPAPAREGAPGPRRGRRRRRGRY
jgi:hypothetical protein